MAGQLFVSLRPCTVSGRDIVNECVERSEELVSFGLNGKSNSNYFSDRQKFGKSKTFLNGK